MKKVIVATAVLCLVAVAASAQVSDLLRKAKEKVQSKIEEKSGTAKQEPASAPPPATGNQPAPAKPNTAPEAPDQTLSFSPISTVDAEKLTDLPVGAFLFYDESYFFIIYITRDVMLVAGNKKDKTYQVFRNGKWSEPMKTLNKQTLQENNISLNRRGSNTNLYRFSEQVRLNYNNNKGLIQNRPKMLNGYLIGEEQVIVHNGKTYGPYAQIQEATLSIDGKHFFAIVMPEYPKNYQQVWQSYRLIGDQLPKPVPLVSEGVTSSSSVDFKLFASGEGKSAAVVVSSYANSKTSQEIVFPDGRRFAVESGSEGLLNFETSNCFFSADGKSFCHLYQGRTLYVNGKPSKTFNEYKHLSSVFLNEKGEELFTISRGGLAFADGTFAPVAIEINTYTDKGKTVVGWLAPYKDGSIYICTKTL